MSFKTKSDPQYLELPEAELVYYDRFFDDKESKRLMRGLIDHIHWKHEEIIIFGRRVLQPRLTAFYGDAHKSYSYSNITLKPHPWNEDLNFIRQRIENVSGYQFTSVLLNYYRDGQDSMGWHSDNEKELGTNPVIASVSFGESRKFMLKHKREKHLKSSIILNNGSFLLMKGPTQHHWNHQIPKTKNPMGARVNLTFRKIL
ncbi:alpha-ketoglutarate-dependent dioxygenase AlkB [Fulvivirgaceae bacterium BMA12]|uniref:Alpha-ketoglutarate-dependent dioxygenase AlkB n=1 Tax=Agaribacillus aureus TaxID=3051825 RepID=A0ABT8LC56_9BACT|nr:alpha-ketoglutarate-dependent dioxygenase AlkB [Fulvivirgaceae bacterium BMA12]